MQAEYFAQLMTNGEHRVQAGHRILEDHGDLIAADFAHFLHGKRQNILSLEVDLALQTGFVQPHDRHGCLGLTAAGLAHDAQGFTGVNIKSDAIQDLSRTIIAVKVQFQVLDFNNFLFFHVSRLLYRSLGSRISRTPSPRMEKARTVIIMARPAYAHW